MNQAIVRTIFRWIHIVFGLPILGYIYDSPTNTPHYAWTISVGLRSRNCPFGIVDVERPCRSTTYFKE